MRRILGPVFALPLVLALTSSAVAQTAMFEGLQTDLLLPRLLLSPEALGVPNRGTVPRPQAPPSPPVAAATDYPTSPEVSARVRQQYLDWYRGIAPSEAAALQAVLDKTDPVAEWAKVVAEDGLRPGDMADSLAAYWLLNWLIANQRTENTPAQAIAVRDQTRRLLATNPKFAGLTPAQRQEVSETWMLNFLVQASAYGAAHRAGDRNLTQRLAAAARARFRNEMGVDLASLTLTPTGFVPKG